MRREGEGLFVEARFLGGPRVGVAVFRGREEGRVEEVGELRWGDAAIGGDERDYLVEVSIGLGGKNNIGLKGQGFTRGVGGTEEKVQGDGVGTNDG